MPITPSGASQSTTRSRPPKNSNLYSARLDSISGSTTLIAAPMAGPSVHPAPPTITASRNKIDCENGKLEGATNIRRGANIAPASPVRTADKANDAVLTITGLSPIERAATSASRTATMPLPQVLVATRWKKAIASPAHSTAMIATSRSVKECEPIDGGTMPISPFWPPVSVRHSMVECSTMKAKAIVTIAR